MVDSGVVTLSIEEMRPGERAVFEALQAAHEAGIDALAPAAIMTANDWDELDEHACVDQCDVCAEKVKAGTRKVYNNLHRLLKAGLVYRNVAAKGYALKGSEKLVKIRPRPKAMSQDDVDSLRRADLARVTQVKKPDCSFYNACLQQAVSGDWPGFSCSECAAYALPDRFQQELDVLALRALQTASEMVEEFGHANRTRGVKPGPDAKRTVRDEDDF